MHCTGSIDNAFGRALSRRAVGSAGCPSGWRDSKTSFTVLVEPSLVVMMSSIFSVVPEECFDR